MGPDLECVPGCAPTPDVGTAWLTWDRAWAHGSGRDLGNMLSFHDLGKWRTNTETSGVTRPAASASKSKGAVLKSTSMLKYSKYTLYTHSCKIAFILENKRKAMISVSYSDRQLYFSGNAIFQETDSGYKP